MTTTTENGRFRRSTVSAVLLDKLGAALARNWWLIALRGVLGVIFGVIALLMPITTILALVLLFSAYMIVDGVFAIYAAIRAAQQGESWSILGVARHCQHRCGGHRIFLAGDHRPRFRIAHSCLVDCLGMLDARGSLPYR